MDWLKLARRGAVEGLLAWIVYWSVESFLLHILPRFNEPSYLYMPPSAGFTALLLAIYAAAGLVTGAAAGIAAGLASGRRDEAEAAAAFRVRPMATLFLCVLVLSSSLPRLPRGMPAWFAVLFFLPAGLALLAGFVSSDWAKRCKLAANPWMAATLLLALPVLFARLHPTLPMAALAMIPFIAAALLLSAVTEASTRRRFLPVGVVAALLLPACLLLRQEPRVVERPRGNGPGAGQPNVILIVLDAVRADHLSLYGYARDTTPNLRSLAAQSTIYTNAISPGDMTLSSHASIFTGFYPSWHKAHFERGYNWGRPLDTVYPVLPEILSAKGFDTAAIVANYLYLAPGFGLDRGFAYHDSSAPSVFLGKTFAFPLRERVRNFLIRYEQPWQYDQVFRRAEEINRDALAFVDREKPQERFFCFLNYMDSHTPYLPPGRYATLFPGYGLHVDMNRYNDLEREVLTRRRPIRDEEREALVSQYDGGIRYMDSALGDLVQKLKQRGLYDNTLLIVTSDHGEAFGEKALIGHALSVYQDMVHVPMVIKYPGQRAAATVQETVSLVDLMPTVLDVLACAAPKDLQGRSLRKAAPENPGRVISESFVHPLFSAMTPRFQRTQQAIFSERLKLIHSSKGEPELYDLSSDAGEEHNLAGTQATDVLETALVQYLNTAARDRHKQAQARTTTENIEKLKSLGYVQGN